MDDQVGCRESIICNLIHLESNYTAGTCLDVCTMPQRADVFVRMSHQTAVITQTAGRKLAFSCSLNRVGHSFQSQMNVGLE